MTTANSHPIGIIGGGLGGLAAACTLAARGHRVTLFEANAWLGGKAAVLAEAGFRFDMGPTILTLPGVLRRIFAEAGRKLDDALKLVRLDPQWRCFFADGTQLDLTENEAAMCASLDRIAPHTGTARGYREFLKLSHTLSDISDRFFFWRPIDSIWDMVDLRAGFQPQLLSDVMSMRMGSSVAQTVRDYLPDERAAQMVDHFTQYVGSDPDQSPAVLCGIAHMQLQEGVWYPLGGTGAVPAALRALAGDLGVSVRSGCRVERIILNDAGRASGVTLVGGETVPLSAVVSNMDTVRTHRELLAGTPAAAQFDQRREYEPACSGVVLYLGLDRRYPELLHHNFVFSRDPHEEFDAIYHRGEPAPDPSCYVCAPAVTEPEVAPPGGEALYILVHTPYLRKRHDWAALYPQYRRVILDKLARTAGVREIESRIRFEKWLSPMDIHTRYNVLSGAIYGLASHGRWTGAFKPGNRSGDVPGLYLAGGSAHPGPGMPMALMSGWIAADTLDRDGVAPRQSPPIQAASVVQNSAA